MTKEIIATELNITRGQMIQMLNEDLARARDIDVPPSKGPADRKTAGKK
jgi:hypothetical protein